MSRPQATPAPAAIAPTPPPKTGSKAAIGPAKRTARTSRDHIGKRVRNVAKRSVIVNRRLRVVLGLGMCASERAPARACAAEGCVGSSTERRSVLMGEPGTASP